MLLTAIRISGSSPFSNPFSCRLSKLFRIFIISIFVSSYVILHSLSPSSNVGSSSRGRGGRWRRERRRRARRAWDRPCCRRRRRECTRRARPCTWRRRERWTAGREERWTAGREERMMEPSASRRFSTQSFSSPARPLRTRYARLPSHDPRNRPPCTWLPRSLRTLSRTRGDFPPRREASRKESACVGSGTCDGSHRRFHSTSTTQRIALGLRRKCRGAIRRCSFAP